MSSPLDGVGMDGEQVERAMGYLAEGHHKALEELLASMSSEHRHYFMGYVAGYTEAIRHLTAAEEAAGA